MTVASTHSGNVSGGTSALTRSEELRALKTISGMRTTPGIRVNQINLKFWPSRSGWAKAGYFDEAASPTESNACAEALQSVTKVQVETTLKIPADVVFPDGNIALIKNVDNRTRKASPHIPEMVFSARSSSERVNSSPPSSGDLADRWPVAQ